MTDLSGSTLSVNRNTWGGDPESLGANRSAYYPRDQSLFCLILFFLLRCSIISKKKIHVT